MSHRMLMRKGDSEFEVTIRLTDEGEWEGRIVEYKMSSLMPTPHLHHSWISLETALAGVTRRWLRLFPDETPPDFHDAVQSENAPD